MNWQIPILKFVSKEEVCEAFVWIPIGSYKSTKIKFVDVQKSFIDDFKREVEFDLFNQNIEISKMIM